MSDPMREGPKGKGKTHLTTVERYRQLQKDAATRRGSLTWSDCPEEELRDMVAAVTEDGAAILLSKTSDSGALVVRVIVDKESIPFYAPDPATLNNLLMEVREMYK